MAGAEVLGGVGIPEPAEVDDSLDPSLPCSFCERCGRVGFGADEIVFVTARHEVGQVVDDVHVPERRFETRCIVQVSGSKLAAQRSQTLGGGGPRIADHGCDGMVTLAQLTSKPSPHKAGGADD